MSHRETHMYHIDTRSTVYQTYEEALKEANSLKIHLQRYCENKNYSCIAYIGVSQYNPKAGDIRVTKNGKREFVQTNLRKRASALPHLHIFILANPGRAVADAVVKYLAKRHPDFYERTEMNPAHRKTCDDYYENVINYVMSQCDRHRISYSNATSLNEYVVNDMCALFEDNNRRRGGLVPIFQNLYETLYCEIAKPVPSDPHTPFTLLMEDTTTVSPSASMNPMISTDTKTLECNSTNNTSKLIDICRYLASMISYTYLCIKHIPHTYKRKEAYANSS